MTTFTPAGEQTTPTITAGIVSPQGVAVDASGKIYVTNYQGPGNKGGFGSGHDLHGRWKAHKRDDHQGIAVPALLTVH